MQVSRFSVFGSASSSVTFKVGLRQNKCFLEGMVPTWHNVAEPSTGEFFTHSPDLLKMLFQILQALPKTAEQGVDLSIICLSLFLSFALFLAHWYPTKALNGP